MNRDEKKDISLKENIGLNTENSLDAEKGFDAENGFDAEKDFQEKNLKEENGFNVETNLKEENGFNAENIMPVVRLRAMEPEDLDALYRIENDRDVWDVGENNVPYSRYILHDYIANASADIYADKQVRMVVENEKGQLVGVADVVNFCPSHARAEVSIVICREHRKKGYARAAIRQIMEYALRTLHLHQLYAVVREDNMPSLNLFSSLGFKSKMVLDDWLFDGKDYHNAVVMQFFL